MTHKCTIFLTETKGKINITCTLKLKKKDKGMLNPAQVTALEMLSAHSKLIREQGEVVHTHAKVTKKKLPTNPKNEGLPH